VAFTQADLDKLEAELLVFRERVQSGDESVQHSMAALLQQIAYVKRTLSEQGAGAARPRVTFASVTLR
jgi:hypothetical protein